MPTYLQKRHRTYYAVLAIPKVLQPMFGKVRFIQTLETDSRVVAERRVHTIVGAWKQSIAEARGEDDHKVWIATTGGGRSHRRRRPDGTYREPIPSQDPRGYGYEVSANEMRVAHQQAKAKAKGNEEEINLVEGLIRDATYHIGSLNYDYSDPNDTPLKDPEAIRFYKRATGGLTKFTDRLNEWLINSNAQPKTIDRQRGDVLRFAQTFPAVADVTRAEVRRWITGLMNDDGLTPKTVQRILSAIRGYWRHLQTEGVAGEDHEPFDRLDVARRNKSTKPKIIRKPFEPADVLKLLAEATRRGDNELADVIRIGMWTGCRIEEICALKVNQVKGDHFTIREAKTDAGRRDVPIHRELAPTITRLIGDSQDGYVLSGLTVNKYGMRSTGVGNRFGRMKRDMGFGPAHVFHSLRKTVVTLLENAGVPENVTADIVGHEKGTVTYGLYSGGASLAVKAAALAKLAYS